MKRCSSCRRVLPLGAFHRDRSRADGRVYVCAACRLVTREGPSRPERAEKRTRGLGWCRDCKQWVAMRNPRCGRCRAHANAADRKRYMEDARHRAERRQHAHARKRDVAPIPADAQADILEDFGGLCAYCDKPATTWDHVVPISRGGRTTPGNVVPACASCNSRKKNRDIEVWLDIPDVLIREPLLERLDLAESGLYG